jgi:uncharacterized membrane protein
MTVVITIAAIMPVMFTVVTVMIVIVVALARLGYDASRGKRHNRHQKATPQYALKISHDCSVDGTDSESNARRPRILSSTG